jgi:hypothetical protein
MDPKQLAVEVHQILSDYIPVHDDLFKASWRRAIPIPGIFQAIDFGAHRERLSQLHTDIESLIASITQRQAAESASSPSAEFLGALEQYASALADTIGRLRDICGRLHDKSKDASSYSGSEYKRDLDAYNTSVARYRALGGRLNSLYARL